MEIVDQNAETTSYFDLGRLQKRHFIALRSLLRSDWRLDSGICWKNGRTWEWIYPNQSAGSSALRSSAFDLVEDLVVRGFVAQTVRDCCASHSGQLVWSLTDRGRRLVDQVDGSLPIDDHTSISSLETQSVSPPLWRASMGCLKRLFRRGSLG